MNFQKVPEGRPLRMAVIGAGNRANKYLEYARRHPERLQPVAVVDGNELRRNETAERFGLASERRYADYDGVAIECQGFPDAPNRPDFPSAELRPGEAYRRTIRFRFDVR